MVDTILAFDTTGHQTTLALYAQGHYYTHVLPEGGSGYQSAFLVPSISALLNQASINYNQINVLATPIGPGSFTGIRLGLATALGFRIARGYSIFAPTGLSLLAFEAYQKQKLQGDIMVVIDTKRGDYFTQTFWGAVDVCTDPEILTALKVQQRADQCLIVNASDLSFSPALSLIHFYQFLTKSNMPIPSDLTPFYCRTPEFTKQKRFQD